MSTRALPGGEAALRVVALSALVMALECGRVLAARIPGLELGALAAGGLALCLTAWGRSPAELGLSTAGLAGRLLGGLALGAVLLLPAAVRWHGGPLIGPELALAAVAVSVGEEVAFRGVLFATLEGAAGPVAAVIGTTLLWTAGHALSHPVEFLPAVAAAGLLLGLWRWCCRDLVAPVVGHVFADLAL